MQLINILKNGSKEISASSISGNILYTDELQLTQSYKEEKILLKLDIHGGGAGASVNIFPCVSDQSGGTFAAFQTVTTISIDYFSGNQQVQQPVFHL